MKRKLLLCVLAAAWLFSGCTKHKATGKEYFIFGIVSADAPGDGVTVYMLKNGNVYADDTKKLTPDNKFIFFKTPMAPVKTEIANQVKFALPEYMKDRPNARFGCPGCTDGPAFYIELRENRNTTWWLIDDRNDAIPPEVAQYADLLRDAIINMQF